MWRPSDFRATPWLAHRHAQTVLPALLRRPSPAGLRPERLELPDGDFLDLYWGAGGPGPVALILHGLAGCATSGYAVGAAGALAAAGAEPVVMQHRGAGGVPNRRRRFYNAAATDDLATVIAHLGERRPGRPLVAVGFSLGGSILLNHLATAGREAPLAAACAVSVPFELGPCAEAIDRGFARLYQWRLLRELKRMALLKLADDPEAPLGPSAIRALPSLRAFDDALTAPLHGFRDADDYYARASVRRRLAAVAVPTTVLHARDDPFVPAATVPGPGELGAAVDLELSERGGHVGFLAGWWPRPWLDERIPAALLGALATGGAASHVESGGERRSSAAPPPRA